MWQIIHHEDTLTHTHTHVKVAETVDALLIRRKEERKEVIKDGQRGRRRRNWNLEKEQRLR